MKKFAKLLSMVLAVSMVLTMFVGAFDYTGANEDKVDAINTVYEAGIMMGNEKGEFMPTANLTRQEMAKIMYALVSYEQEADDIFALYASLSFSDYAAIPAWSKAYMGYAAVAEIIVGNAAGEANAKGTLSYVEAAIMLLRSLNLEGTYDDGGEEEVPMFTGSKWYQNAVLAATFAGLYDDLDIDNYKAAITREDVAVMIANAIAIADDEYALAEKVTGIVTGVEEVEIDEEDVEVFVVVGDYTEYIPTEGYDVDAVIGYEIEAIVEGDATLELTVVDNIAAGTALFADIELVDVDEDDDDVVDYQNVEINGEVVIEEFVATDYSWFYAENSAEYATVYATTPADYDEVAYIINENSIFVTYAPVVFDVLAEDWADLIEEAYDAEEKAWTGEWYWGEIEVTEYVDLELEAGTPVSYQIVDDVLVNLETLTIVDGNELDATFTVADGYAVSYKGNEIYNLTGVTAAEIWANVTLEAEDWFAVLYNDYVLVSYVYIAPEEEEEAPDTVFYAFLGDYAAELEIVVEEEDDEEVTYYDWTVTVEALIDGEETELSFVLRQETLVLDLTGYEWLNADFVKAVVTAEGEFVSIDAAEMTAAMVTELGEDGLVAGTLELDDEDLADVLFVDMTEAGVELADITVETEGEKTTTKVDGKRVSALSVVAFYVDEYVVVVYDPACEFGIYGEAFIG